MQPPEGTIITLPPLLELTAQRTGMEKTSERNFRLTAALLLWRLVPQSLMCSYVSTLWERQNKMGLPAVFSWT